MPSLTDIFQTAGPQSYNGSQCYEAQVVQVTSQGVYVILPRWSTTSKWGPLKPDTFKANVGDTIAVSLSDLGLPWALGGSGGGGGAANDVDITASAVTLPPQNVATVQVAETSSNIFVFTFGLPKGATGPTGPPGRQVYPAHPAPYMTPTK